MKREPGLDCIVGYCLKSQTKPKQRWAYLERNGAAESPYIPGLCGDVLAFLVQTKLRRSGEHWDQCWANWKDLSKYTKRSQVK